MYSGTWESEHPSIMDILTVADTFIRSYSSYIMQPLYCGHPAYLPKLSYMDMYH